MNSLTVDSLSEKCVYLISNFANGQIPGFIKEGLKWAETTRSEDAPINDKDITEQKIAAEIFIDNVNQLKNFLAGTSVNKIETSVKNNDYCKLISVLKGGNVVTLHYTVPKEDQGYGEWKLSVITWEEKSISYKLEIP